MHRLRDCLELKDWLSVVNIMSYKTSVKLCSVLHVSLRSHDWDLGLAESISMKAWISRKHPPSCKSAWGSSLAFWDRIIETS